MSVNNELYAIRASGLIPVIPLTTIIKILNFNCVFQNKRSITDALAGVITSIYTSQRRYTTYCTIQSMNRDLVRPSPATRGGRATGIIGDVINNISIPKVEKSKTKALRC